MAKKNKKNTKINQKIRKYFDDDPFDVGVERVSTQTLSELFQALGIYDVEQSRDALIKTIRMLWSQGDIPLRQEILDFFHSNGHIYASSRPKEPNIDKEQRIQELLSELDITNEESHLLHQAFLNVRTRKITIEKMETKLHHIRFDAKKREIEKAVDGLFDLDDSLEFNASLRYRIFNEHFYKILTLNTKPYDYEYLEETPIEEIIHKISLDKEKIIELKQESINKFIQNLEIPHPYLTNREIELSLRSSPPKTNLKYPLLKEGILHSLIETKLDVIDIKIHSQELLVRVYENFSLPHSNRTKKYIL